VAKKEKKCFSSTLSSLRLYFLFWCVRSGQFVARVVEGDSLLESSDSLTATVVNLSSQKLLKFSNLDRECLLSSSVSFQLLSVIQVSTPMDG
jgi:nitrogen fixation-related uncharacterized protein